jgi:hypothetical protein
VEEDSMMAELMGALRMSGIDVDGMDEEQLLLFVQQLMQSTFNPSPWC